MDVQAEMKIMRRKKARRESCRSSLGVPVRAELVSRSDGGDRDSRWAEKMARRLRKAILRESDLVLFVVERMSCTDET